MFSFHKPKIYRSLSGCCICRAKSSSSRFTDSKKYEQDFTMCFLIDEPRAGEICNACVLLVKRWKKLPSGSCRNWHHVVDARAGPGTKSITKMKSKNKEDVHIKKKKHKHRFRLKPPPSSPGGLSDDIIMGDELHSDCGSNYSGSGGSDCSDDELSGCPRESGCPAPVSKEAGRRGKKGRQPVQCSSFLDLTYWKKTEICCGIIFKGANGECLVDTALLRPCRCTSQNSSRSTSRGSSSTPSTHAPSPALHDPSPSHHEQSPSEHMHTTAPEHIVGQDPVRLIQEMRHSPQSPEHFQPSLAAIAEQAASPGPHHGSAAAGSSLAASPIGSASADGRPHSPVGSASADCLQAAEAVLDLSLPKQSNLRMVTSDRISGADAELQISTSSSSSSSQPSLPCISLEA